MAMCLFGVTVRTSNWEPSCAHETRDGPFNSVQIMRCAVTATCATLVSFELMFEGYTFLIQDIYHPDALYECLHEQGVRELKRLGNTLH